MTEHKNIKEHPEGVEVVIEILKNVPTELLREFGENFVVADEYDKDHSLNSIWCGLIDKRFENE